MAFCIIITLDSSGSIVLLEGDTMAFVVLTLLSSAGDVGADQCSIDTHKTSLRIIQCIRLLHCHVGRGNWRSN